MKCSEIKVRTDYIHTKMFEIIIYICIFSVLWAVRKSTESLAEDFVLVVDLQFLSWELETQMKCPIHTAHRERERKTVLLFLLCSCMPQEILCVKLTIHPNVTLGKKTCIKLNDRFTVQH